MRISRTGTSIKTDRLRDASGFTMLEIVLVLFLLVGLLGVVIPRMAIGDNLTSVGRKWVAVLRALQEMSISIQSPVRLYIDLDRGLYWPMVLQGGEEKVPLDTTWLTPLSLPETIHVVDIQVGQTKTSAGRADMFFYPNGQIDSATMHLVDGENRILGIQIEPVTANIRLTDQRIDPPKPWTMPERIRLLLQVQTALFGAKQPLPPGQP